MRLTLFFLTLLACTGDVKPGSDSGSGGPGGEEGGDGSEPECATDTECGDGEICEAEACVDGDRDNSVAEATALVWESTVSGVINPDGDKDYYSFIAEGGEFVQVATVFADPTDAEDKGFDTALTLRNAAGKVVASVDDYPSGHQITDNAAYLFAYLSEAGTYTIAVEDINTWSGDGDGVGDPAYAYNLTIKEYDGHTRETDSFDTTSLSAEVKSGHTLYPIGILLETAGDSDWVDLSFPYGDAGLYVYGMQDLGTSTALPKVRLWDLDGNALTDKVGVGPEGAALYPAAEATSYRLELTDSVGGGDDDAWFFVFLYAEDEGDAYPSESESNDSLETANSVSQYLTETDEGNDYTYGKIQGALDPLGDVDSFSIEGMEGSYLIVCLNSSPYGSSVAPSVDLYGSDGALLDGAVGDPGADDGTTILENVPVTDDDYILVVSDPAGVASGPGAWYRMLVYVTTFETDQYSCP